MILKGLLKTQLLVHSLSEDSAERKNEGRESLGDIYINLWLLPSEGRRSECWNVEQPLPNLNTSQVTAAQPAACSLPGALPEGNF